MRKDAEPAGMKPGPGFDLSNEYQPKARTPTRIKPTTRGAITQPRPRRWRTGPTGPTLVQGLSPGGRKRGRTRGIATAEYIGPVPQTYRIVVAKPGLDGHDRGAKIVARALRDAGFEVIYTGLHQTPEQIAETAIQEDADAVGLSCHSGAHMTLFPKVVRLLHEQGAGDVLVFGGGIIPKEDIPKLAGEGIEKIFTPGAPTTEIVAWLRERLGEKATA